MSNAERQILERLRSLYRYERRRAFLSSTLFVISGLAVGVSVGSGVATLFQSKVGAVVATVGLFVICLVYQILWLVRTIMRSKPATSQAANVEKVYPSFRMRLVTVAERLTGSTKGPLEHESPAIFSSIVGKVLLVMPSVKSRRVHPVSLLFPSVLVVLGALAPLSVATIYGEPAPHELLSWVTSEESVEEDEIAQAPLIEDAVVAEISFVYIYPEYTGLSPLEVRNSNGTAHGPPGTQVLINARTGEPVSGAVVVVNDAVPEAVTIEDGRDLSTSITLVEDGFWRFQLRI